jgi:hypothetical protein
LVFAKGWTAPAILILKTVVDPSIASLAVAMFLFMANVVNSIAAAILGKLTDSYHLDPTRNPSGYGDLVTAMTVIPCSLSIPFFLISGYKLRTIKRRKIALGEIGKNELNDEKEFIK